MVGHPWPSATPPAGHLGRRRVKTRRSLIRRATNRLSLSWSLVSKHPARSPAPTSPCETRGALTTGTAGVARRLGRQPSEVCGTLAATIGSSTIVPACGPTRSRTVGIPSGRCRPSGVGIETRRTGGGLSLPARRSGASAWRQVVTPCRSTSSLCTSSMPALPPWARTSRQARHSMSGRQMRSSSAWHRRFRRLLAAW